MSNIKESKKICPFINKFVSVNRVSSKNRLQKPYKTCHGFPM